MDLWIGQGNAGAVFPKEKEVTVGNLCELHLSQMLHVRYHLLSLYISLVYKLDFFIFLFFLNMSREYPSKCSIKQLTLKTEQPVKELRKKH